MRTYGRYGDLIGQMRQPIAFYRINSNKNTATADAPSETLIWSCQASVRSSRMAEPETAATIISLHTITFTVRYSDTIDDPTLVIRYREQDYDIESIDDMYGDRAFMAITAVRRM